MDRISRIHIAKVPYEISTDAQELLNKYLRAIRSKLDWAIAEEVIADVEVRITQILADRKIKQNDVITDEDIRAVQEKLGSPEQFTDSDEKEPAQVVQKPRRLMRDVDGAYICGVASGLGAYFGVDPIFVRIAFVLLTFVSGLGILLYILFWILVPPAKTPAEQLEMTGRPVTLDTLRDYRENVRQNLEEGRTSAQRVIFVLGRILLALCRAVCAVIFIGAVLFGLSGLGALTSAALFVSPFKGLFASYKIDYLALGLIWAVVISVAALLLILLRGLFARGNAMTRVAAMAFGGILISSLAASAAVGVVTVNHFTQVYGNGKLTTALNISNQNQTPITSLDVKSDQNLRVNYVMSSSGPMHATYQAYPGLGTPNLSLTVNNGTLLVDSNNLAKAAPSCFGALCQKIYLPIKLTIYGPPLTNVKDESGADVMIGGANLPQGFDLTATGGSNVELEGSFGDNMTISAEHGSGVDAGSTTAQSATINVDSSSNVVSPSTSSLTANIPEDCSQTGSVLELNSFPGQAAVNGRILSNTDLNANSCIQLGAPVPPPQPRIMQVSPRRFQ